MKLLNRTFLLAVLTLLAACGGGQMDSSTDAANAGVALDVYKSETCGCCGVWVEYMEKLGYATTVHHPEDLNATKAEFGIAPQWQSCHTAVTKEGYVFEGHIPEKFVAQFLTAPPENAIGLAVPGMPLGSPGMEMGDRFTPYEVVQLNKDGSTVAYASITSAQEQF